MSKKAHNFNSIFAERLGILLDSNHSGKKTTQKELADKIKTTRQTVSEYRNGTSIPNADKLKSIAEFFDVSADYLIGITDEPTKDRDLQAVYDKIGLSSTSINELLRYEDIDLKIHNHLMERGYLPDAIKKMRIALIEHAVLKLKYEAINYPDSDRIGDNVFMRFKIWEVEQYTITMFNSFYSDFLKEYSEMLDEIAQEKKDEYKNLDMDATWSKLFERIQLEVEDMLDGLPELSAEELSKYKRHEDDEE
jgi:transcriptional regulator with XRE-family HTH domain